MAQDTPSRKLDQYIVRFPDGMRDRLKEEAADNNRSLNSEIVDRLEQSLSAEQAASALDQLMDRTWEERKQMINVINSQDLSLQALRQSHGALVTIARQLGQTFLDHMENQPDFLVALAQMLSSLEADEVAEPSEPIPERPWEQGYPDPEY